ncbi:SusC/RagA family TonB-linked outer membrane protein [Marinilabiliaceae bacterium JC017]|nr:SusC/RagA family TonB-linked outer membrane protein [Marinilabiliaceae bacterium JC017]
MNRFFYACFILLTLGMHNLYAQTQQVTGTVTGKADGQPIPGVSVAVKGTTLGTITDIDGNYSLSLSENAESLQFSFIGMKTLEIAISNQTVINVQMESDAIDVDEVVVTALGIKREEKSLGYAVTKVKGEELMKAQSANVTSALSGRVAGVNITSGSGIGGSTNVVIRGGSSITQSNQALYVIDGIPVSNTSVNTGAANSGRGGYDNGNAAADINPDDIESISVLKGASATALYGSRGANGVILITTKKGKTTNRIGVNINSSVQFQKINRATLPEYQDQYGGGDNILSLTRDGYSNWYGDNISGGFRTRTIDGVEYKIVDYGTDESWGPKYDPNVQVVHWDGIDQDGNITETRPWIKPEHGPEAYFQTGIMYNNNISLEGASDKGSFRVSYTNLDQTGTTPKSELKKNTLNFNATQNLNDRLSTTVVGTWTNTKTKNRPKVGYDWQAGNSFMATTAMWMQTNVDYKRLENYQYANGLQRTWNRSSFEDGHPNYWNNPYWVANKNYPTDERNRLVGSWMINYKITDWLNAMGRVTMDHYDWSIETRNANHSKGTSSYDEYTRIATELNYDFILTFNKTINDWSINGLLGASQRDNNWKSTYNSTRDGIVLDDLYNIKNSRSAEIFYTPQYLETTVRSIYGTGSIGYKNQYYLELTARNDWSSTLPENNNSYFYPSITGSWIFTEALDWKPLSFGKLRANYAEVGNSATYASILDTYANYGNHGGDKVFRYSTRSTKNNSNLKPEKIKSYELGFDTKWFNNRVGLDFSYFNKLCVDQIIDGTVSAATGYYRQWMNLGEREIAGYEIDLFLNPIQTKDFAWDMNINWSTYTDEINELAPGVNSHILNNNDVFIVARVGESYPIITGNDYKRDPKTGKKLINKQGFYEITDEGQKIGELTPDWRGGLTNDFRYKNWSLHTLIDFKIGGDIYSQTHRWGRQTGILKETVGNNDLGNPLRDPAYVYEYDESYYDQRVRSKDGDGNDILAENPGGVILDGVVAEYDANGNIIKTTPNETRVEWKDALDSGNNPMSASIFDASYVKLREVALEYRFNKNICEKLRIANLSVTLIGRNLAIIHSNVDHIDPELTYGAGNIQGMDYGTLPTARTFGFNVKLGF